MIDRDTAGAKRSMSDSEMRLLLRALLLAATAAFAIASGATFYFLTSAVLGSSYFGVAPSAQLALDPTQTRLDQLTATDAVSVTEVVAIVDGMTDGAGYRIWAAANGLGTAALAAGLWMIRVIILSVSQANPFVADNVTRLRIVGTLLAVVPIVVAVGQGIATDLLVDTATGAVFDLNFAWLFGGLLVLVLAEVWAQGIDMRDELELTI